MATLVASRIYKGDIIPILTASRMSLARAKEKLKEIANFPGIVYSQDEEMDIEGELWVEIEDAEGELVSSLIRFAPWYAMTTLIRTGVSEEEATRLLSDVYAEQYLDQLWDRK